ncbi:MAG: TonB-dependent receptor [Saprospiraceae bacterium]
MHRAIFLLFFLYQLPLFAQTLSGTVAEPSGGPAAFATLRLRSWPDSVLLAGTTADSAGVFVFQSVNAGRYILQAGLIGFEDAFRTIDLDQEAGGWRQSPLTLGTAPLGLAEATVTARKPVIERLVDKTVVNIEGTALATDGSGYDLLQRSPGVVITPQDAVLLNGKSGTMVMIDGRPTQLSGAELGNLLRSIPADNIAAIELIAQPSGKYDAQGVGGIINIRLKRRGKAGWSGSVNGSYSQSLHHRAQAGANLNYRPGAVHVFAQYTLNDAAQLVEQQVERQTGSFRLRQSNPATSAWNSQFWKTGLDWNIDRNNSAGFLLVGSAYDNLTHAVSNSDLYAPGQSVPDSTLHSERRAPEQNRRLNFNLNYRYADTLGLEWTIDLDRIYFNQNTENELDIYGQADVATWLNTRAAGHIGVWVAKTDLSKNLASGCRLETGLKNAWSDSEQLLFSQTGDASQPQGIEESSSRFSVQENIFAAYANLGGQAGRWRWQIGLRAEHTRVLGRSQSTDIGADNRPDTAYLSLFPTAFLQFSPAGNHQFSLALNRRLDRPAYQDLNPFTWPTDPYSAERGNPYLRPAFSRNGELGYTYKDAASLTLGYSSLTDVVSSIAVQENKRTVVQPANLARQNQWSLNLNTPLPLASWWNGELWIGVWHSRFQADLPEGRLDARSWGGGCWLNHSFSLPRKIQLSVSGWAQFPTRDGMFTNRGIWSANLSVKKKMLGDRLTVRLACWDLFNSQRWTQEGNLGAVNTRFRNNWESQQINLGMTWNFGKNTRQGREREIGAEKENARIKSNPNQ